MLLRSMSLSLSLSLSLSKINEHILRWGLKKIIFPKGLTWKCFLNFKSDYVLTNILKPLVNCFRSLLVSEYSAAEEPH